MVDESSLVGYCGLHCGACAIYQKMIRKRATQLLEILNAYQFREIAKEAKEWYPKLAFYSQFEEVLQSLMKMFGECPSCLAGGGPPVCMIRDCCKEMDSPHVQSATKCLATSFNHKFRVTEDT